MQIIKNATLHTMAGIDGEQGYVAFENGRIVETGRRFDPARFPGADIHDAQGRIVTPGLIDPHCHIGVVEEGIQFEGMDHNEMTNPIFPELRGIDSLYPGDSAFQSASAAGVTTVVTGPGSANVIGGTFTAVKTVGETVEDMVLREEVAMKMALGENPKRVYSGQKKSPSTRMASAALMREWLIRAQEYRDKLTAYEEGQAEDKPAFDMKLHSLMRVFEGMKVKIHAHRSDDITTAVRVAGEFGLDASIDHGTEAHLIPSTLKQSGLAVILGPTLGAATKYETASRTFKSAGILDSYQVPISIMTDHPVVPAENALVQVALFVKAGLPREKALRAVTLDAARVNGLEDRVGSLEPGKDADLVIWEGDPLDIMSDPARVYIDGNPLRI